MLIFLRELKRNRKAFVIWILILAGFNAMMFAFFPSLSGEAQKIKDLMDVYPDSMKSAFGLDRLDMSTIMGFYGIENYLFIALLGSIYAMLLGAGILSKEESDGTIEFLLSKPVTRNKIVTGKALCVLFYILLFNIIMTSANFIFFEIFKKEAYSIKAFVLVSVGPLLLHLTFSAIGFFISMFIVKAKAIYPIAIGAVMGAYLISIVSSISEKAEALKYITPFKYVDASELIIEEKIRIVYLAIIFFVITASITASYVIYNKKDITI